MVWNKSMLGKILRDGVLKDGLIETLKPAVEAAQPELDKAKAYANEVLEEAGLQQFPDPAQDPRGALKFQLNELVRHLLQTPKSQAFYVLGELTGVVTTLVSAHPKIGGLIGLAQAMGMRMPGQRSPERAAAASLMSILGPGRKAQAMAESGQAMLSANKAYEKARQHARQYQDLNEIQQHVVDQATLVAAMLNESSVTPQAINEAIEQLSTLLASNEEALYADLEYEHQAGIRWVCDKGLVQQPLDQINV